MGRPKRQAAQKNKDAKIQYGAPDEKWNLKETRLFLAGLKKYSKDDIQNIAKHVGTKSSEQVKYYMDRMSLKNPKVDPVAASVKAPIEAWKEMLFNLVRYEHDFSDVLTRVMSIAGSLEPHLEPVQGHVPNYPLLYKYIVALMKGDSQLPRLGALESAVMVSLIESLAMTLNSVNYQPQRKLMREKYKLLNQKVVPGNQETYKAARRALEEDLLAPQVKRSEMSASTSGIVVSASTSATATSASTSATATSASTSATATSASTSVTATSASTSAATSSVSSASTSATAMSAASTSVSATSAMSAASSSVTEMSAVSASTSASASPSSHSQSGKTNNSKQEVSDSVNSEHSQSAINPPPDGAAPPLAGGTTDNTHQTNGEDNLPKKGRKRKTTSRIATMPKKSSSLFSLNPFCIPVKYLNPK